jgi:late competence protein required for DNA uptake (superfamily II DNA/RNA helicase)
MSHTLPIPPKSARLRCHRCGTTKRDVRTVLGGKADLCKSCRVFVPTREITLPPATKWRLIK